jgi:PTH1 family peptidyl-tRNA hydrolase
MKLVVGLGNPGPKYELTRHNVGFLAIDRLAEKLKAQGPAQKFQGELFTAKVDSEQVLLLKPQTFMNLSGRSVGAAATFYKIPPTDIITIHDELDLPPLTFKIKTGGGAAGHNGLRSMEESIGAQLKDDKNGHQRIRMGIGQPLLPSGRRVPAEQHVLEPFTDEELKALDPLLDQVTEAITMILRGELTRAMNRFNASPKK